MALFYQNQAIVPLIGSKSSSDVITAKTLTASYETESADVATKTFPTGMMSRVEFSIKYTMGASETTNSIEIRLEGGNEGTNFFRLMNDSTSAGTSTLTVREFTYVGINAAASSVSFGVDIAYKFMRIAIKETGVATNFGTIFCEALLSGN